MKPANFAKMLEAQAAVVEIGGGGSGEVAGQLRQVAGFFAGHKAASVATALKAAPTGASRPGHFKALLTVLDHTAEVHRAQSATSGAIKDVKALSAALGIDGKALDDIIAGWHAPQPAAKAGRTRAATARPKSPSQAADRGKLVEEYAGQLRGAHYDSALAAIDRIAADKRLTGPDLRALLAAVHRQQAPSKATRTALIDMLKRPFLDDRIDADKTRAIRAGGAL